MTGFLVQADIGVGAGQAQIFDLRHGLVDEFLAQLVIGGDLDLPGHALRRMHRILIGRAEHHQRRIPEAVERILRHGLLFGSAEGHLHHDVIALTLVETFFLADAHHGAGIGAVRGALQMHLIHDRGAIHQPADRPHIGPGQGRVVEDRRIFHLALMQQLDQLVPADAQCFSSAVKVKAVARLVLHLGQQDRLAFQGGRAGDPVALGQLADNLGMGVLADLADQCAAIVIGHPVLGLDLFIGVHTILKGAFLFGHLVARFHTDTRGFHHLCIHVLSPEGRFIRRPHGQEYEAHRFVASEMLPVFGFFVCMGN